MALHGGKGQHGQKNGSPTCAHDPREQKTGEVGPGPALASGWRGPSRHGDSYPPQQVDTHEQRDEPQAQAEPVERRQGPAQGRSRKAQRRRGRGHAQDERQGSLQGRSGALLASVPAAGGGHGRNHGQAAGVEAHQHTAEEGQGESHPGAMGEGALQRFEDPRHRAGP